MTLYPWSCLLRLVTVPLALFTGLVMPTLIAAAWGDAMGGYIWGGLVARVLGMDVAKAVSRSTNDLFSVALYIPCELVSS